jgi:hypothetical protein
MKGLKILISVVLLGLTFYLTDWFLKENFSDNGEAYLKGAGHLLQEKFWSGLFFLVVRHLTVSALLFYLLFIIVGENGKAQAFHLLRWVAFTTLATLLVFLIYQASNIVSKDYDRKERIFEIGVTWFLRVAGFFVGFWLTKLNSRNVKLQ